MTLLQLMLTIERAPRYFWDRYSEKKRDEAILALAEYLDSKPVGTKLAVGSFSDREYRPSTLEKVSATNWKGFFYDYEEGIKAIDMAEFAFRNMKATGYYTIRTI